MRERTKRLLPLLMALLLVVSIVLPANAAPASQKIITTPTGYTKAEDVDYLEVTGQFYDPVAKKNITKTIVANWGARGEDALFLTSYATAFYTGTNTYASFAQLSGSTQQNQVPSSALYQALQDFMEAKHTFYTEYDGSKNVRAFYKYTDCVSNDTSQVSLLYQGHMKTSEWNKGEIWNQEHCWPQSKCTSNWQIGDIMQLRPADPSENSRRSNDSYGEKQTSDYYNPGVSVRGDCARMMLYMYVRWGNTGKMWGSSGVMESVDILLKWMEEDPVDTWEMARNDSVQSITGTRNVFVDYPELAFLLFSEEIPANMTTPSGGEGVDIPNTDNTPPAGDNTPPAGDTTPPAGDTTPPAGDTTPPAGDTNPPAGDTTPPAGGNSSSTTTCTHTSTKLVNQKAATCTEAGYTGDKVCAKCSKKLETGTAIAAGHKDVNQDGSCDICTENLCAHTETEIKNEKPATCQAEGFTGDKICVACGYIVEKGTSTPKTDHRSTVTGQKDATCSKEGYSGDTVCGDCNEPIIDGTVIPATGNHSYGDWVTEKEATNKETGLQTRTCTECGHKESKTLPVVETSYTWVIAAVVVVVGVAAAGIVFYIKKKTMKYN